MISRQSVIRKLNGNQLSLVSMSFLDEAERGVDQEGLRIQAKGSELPHGQSREQKEGEKYRVFFLLRGPVFNLRRNLLDCSRRHSRRIYHRHNNSNSIHCSASVGCKANGTVVLIAFLILEENIPRDPVFHRGTCNVGFLAAHPRKACGCEYCGVWSGY